MAINPERLLAVAKKHPLPALGLLAGGLYVYSKGRGRQVGAMPVYSGAQPADPGPVPIPGANYSYAPYQGASQGAVGPGTFDPAQGYYQQQGPQMRPTSTMFVGAVQHVGDECGNNNAIKRCHLGWPWQEGSCINPVTVVKGVVQCGASVAVAGGAAALAVGGKAGPAVAALNPAAGAAVTAVGNLGSAIDTPEGQPVNYGGSPAYGYGPVYQQGYQGAPQPIPQSAPRPYTPAVPPYASQQAAQSDPYHLIGGYVPPAQNVSGYLNADGTITA